MSRFRLASLTVTSTLALTVAAGLYAVPVFAQTAAPATSDTTEVVVTGTRTARRSRLDTLAPVDVVKSESLTTQGNPELAEGLSRIAPSISFPRPAVTDGTDSVRPAILRGLSPDQTLVLVNGKRRHASALVNINGSVGRGAAAVDLNTIPEAALNTVEVLRDGASAQYGSDAIAGVINLRLKTANHGGGASVAYGQYDTDVNGTNTSYHKADGGTVTVSAWQGFKLGSDGFLTVSGEWKDRHPTSRGGLDTRLAPDPSSVTSRYGDPAERALTLFYNSEKPINDTWTAYSFGSYQNRYDQSAANFRPYNNTGNVLSIYPKGFLPMIDAHTKDYSLAGGMKGLIGGWTSDFSLVYGDNELIYHTTHSVNSSYGAASQTGFYSGELHYNELVGDANFSKAFDVGFAAPLDVAFGFEGRSERYQVEAGDVQSYSLGPVAGGQQGAQGFPGLFPVNVQDKSRTNVGAYLDLETSVTDKFSVAGALRTEHYSDFGDNTSGKFSARYDLMPSFAVRGSISTGFRAPSLQQQYFSSTATNFVNGVPLLIYTMPVSSPVAIALGATPLKPEKSTNFALGWVYHEGPFEMTVDGYEIKIKDRIILSENLIGKSGTTIANAGVYALLQPYGVDAARFFMNGVDTTTKGIDVVAHYRFAPTSLGNFDLGVAANHTVATIDRFPAINKLSSLPTPPALFARVNQNLLTGSTPAYKVTTTLDWKLGNFSAAGAVVYYSSVYVANSNAALDFTTGNKFITNLSGTYKLPWMSAVSVGVDNLFDVYPKAVPIQTLAGSTSATLASTGYNGAATWSARSPFGFNGRYIYAKVSKSW